MQETLDKRIAALTKQQGKLMESKLQLWGSQQNTILSEWSQNVERQTLKRAEEIVQGRDEVLTPMEKRLSQRVNDLKGILVNMTKAQGDSFFQSQREF